MKSVLIACLAVAAATASFAQYFVTPMVELAYKQAKGEPTVESLN